MVTTTVAPRPHVLMPSRDSLDHGLHVSAAAWVALVATLVAEAAHWALGLEWYVGRIPVMASLFPAVALVVLARRTLWLAGGRLHTVTAVLCGLCVGALYWYTANVGNLAEALALLQVGVGEEVVFRLALPAVLAAAMVRCSVRATVAWPLAWVVAAATFAAMPGHVAQASTLVGLAPFVGFSVLATLVLWRTGNLVAIVLWHATFDLLTLPVALSGASLEVRQVGMLGTAVVMIAGAYWAAADPAARKVPAPVPVPVRSAPVRSVARPH